MPKARSNKTRSHNTTTVDAATTVPDTDEVQPPRPSNSFIVYRSALCKDMNEQGRMSVLNKMPEVVKADCKDVTGFLLSLEERSPTNPGGGKSIGPFAARWWKAMTPEEKAPWEAKAARLKEEHEVKYPGYKYKPSAPGTKKSGKPRKKAKKEVVARDESTMTMPTLASGSHLPQPIANSPGFDSHAQHPATWYGMSQQPALYDRAMHTDQQTFNMSKLYQITTPSPSTFQAPSGEFGRNHGEMNGNQMAAADDRIYGSTITLPQLLPVPETSRMGEWPSASFYAPLDEVQDVPDEINQMPGSGNGIYATVAHPQVAFEALSMPTYGMLSTATQDVQNTDDNIVNGHYRWAGQTGSLAMPSPFDASNAPTPENAQEDLPSTSLDGHGYSHQGYVESSSNAQLEASVPQMPMGNELSIDWQAYNWGDMSAFTPAFDLANLNLPDFAFNEPEGFEGSAEILAQLENNNTAPNGGQWEHHYSF